MNEDQDFNESLASEDATKENADVTQNDENSENLGEAVSPPQRRASISRRKRKQNSFQRMIKTISKMRKSPN
jgi:hypothetical protein